MTWFIVTGRHDGDDDDTLFILEAQAARHAEDEARERLECEDYCADQRDQPAHAIYITYTVNCGTTKPEQL